ncbi:MAG: CHC2 zinc finger domain-containing protein [Acidobacteriota bacterium]|nr:CHC2 zinc finger domain-containing protein [Acidobacteriota bacterium]
MTNWIDLKELRKQLQFADVLRHYGVETRECIRQYHGFCPLPLHQGKLNSQSFSANLERGIWQCFGCGEKGNALDFAVFMEGANPKSGKDVQRVASELQKKLFGGSTTTKSKREPEQGEEVVVNAPLDFELKGLDAQHPYLQERGFSAETIAHFGLGYCARGLLGNRIAIPLHDETGEFVGYAGRVIDDKTITEENPKYKFPGRRKRKKVIHQLRKSLLLYNADRVAAPVDDLVVVEGFTGVWWLWQAGIVNVVSTMGAACSRSQAHFVVSLVSPCGRVWIFTDGDSAGTRCTEEMLIRIAPYRFTRWVKVEAGKQPTSFWPSELKQLFAF